MCKGAHALGILHEYAQEFEVLGALLAQTRWRRGRRGRWHDRRATLITHHFRKAAESPAELRELNTMAMEGVVAALQDEDTHIVFRPMLERRLTALEKKLRVPDDERHQCEGTQEGAIHVAVVGVRVDKRMQLDEAGCVVNMSVGGTGKEAKAGPSLLPFLTKTDAIPRKPGVDVSAFLSLPVTGKSYTS